jgi:WD40 repeat protein
VKVYDGQTYRLRGPLNAGKAHAVACSPDGKRLVTAAGTRVRLWDSTTLREVASFDAPAELGQAIWMSFSPDGKTLLLGSKRSHFGPAALMGNIPIRAWNAAGQEAELPAGKVEACCAPVYSPDGASLFVLKREDVQLKMEKFRLDGRDNNQGPGLAEGGFMKPEGKGFVSICDTATGQEKQVLDFGGMADLLALAPDGQTLAVMRIGRWTGSMWVGGGGIGLPGGGFGGPGPLNPPAGANKPFVASVRGTVKLWHYHYASPGQR